MAALTLMAVLMVLFVHIFSTAAVNSDIRSDIEKASRRNLKYVTFDGETLILSEGFVTEEEGYFFILLNQDGEILAGEYPDGFPSNCEIVYYRTRQVKNSGTVYYVRDTRRTSQMGQSIIMRGIVRKADVDSRYQTMEHVAWGSILVIYAIVICCGIVLSGRISHSMKEMCRTAETIGNDLNISQRMEYKGPFYELAILAQANNRMLDRMENMFRQQEQLTSDVAHELRTPIAVSMAQCQYVKQHMDNQDEVEMAFDVIYRQSQKINAIILQLLHLSRFNQGRVQLQAEEIDLAEIAETVCEDEREKAGDGICIRLTRKGEACCVGDINLIIIAVSNLVSNAVKFSGEDGAIDVETGCEEDTVYVSVRDYGKGISEEEQKHIFERFYKADKSRNSDGFGLGLALTKKIAEAHGGDVAVSSEVGRGSVFWLKLPEKDKSR